MGKIVVFGGTSLFGEVTVGGSKNAALPIIFSTLLLRGVSEIDNVPNISDIEVSISIIESFGARVTREGKRLVIDTSEVFYAEPDASLVSRIRASTYLIGASLARFGRARIGQFGGCSFSPRPIDMHLYAAEALGARHVGDTLLCELPHSANIVFDKISVGATVNAVLMALLAPGVTRITPYAKEPHVTAFFDFLRSAGASISTTDDTLTVRGGTRLCGGKIRLPGDMIEAGTYLLTSLITGGEITVFGVNPEELSALHRAFSSAGAHLECKDGGVSFCGTPTEPITVIAEPYPGFPTDLQPIAAAALAKARGGVVRDTVFKTRYGYLTELSRFGVKSKLTDDEALIYPSPLTPAIAYARDLRCGAAALSLALGVDGESVIENSEMILRGYESVEDKLSALGAKIEVL